MSKRPQVEADIAETEAATEAASAEAPSAGSDPSTDPVAGPSAGSDPLTDPVAERAGEGGSDPKVDAMPDAEDLENLRRERDEYLELAQRTRAELENFRKRSAKDAQEAERRGRAHVARGLVPAVDNLERALQAAGIDLDPKSSTESPDPASREVSAHEALAAGVALVHGEIVGALRSAGVESFDPAGQKFDPSVCEALSTRPAADGEETGVVAETLQRGYSIGDVLIRPARVVVTS